MPPADAEFKPVARPSLPASASVPVLDRSNEEEPLDEFMMGLSARDKRVEMIHGFYASERAAGHMHDTAANYSARLKAFENAPA